MTVSSQSVDFHSQPSAAAPPTTVTIPPLTPTSGSTSSTDPSPTTTSPTLADHRPSIAKAYTAPPPLDRQFPKPPSDIDLTEALRRAPGRWTIQGSISAKEAAPRQPRADRDIEQLKAQRIIDLETAKAQLFAYSDSMQEEVVARERLRRTQSIAKKTA
ncbi:hypothetical protein HYQ45_008040 [Verticillium longisporum]|uniref:Uncharacterized protein n=2 Tax=Verticillium TaxID=1036719 RepID=A0A8I3ATT2_VERLO|nr:tRNA modification GTPase mnmE [Verticillium dahliae VDG1]KAG7133815.1 hypothetical protein HYQ45_008040 [Verticillium longisporum]PNH72525.1 hypothetical protein VD0001_g5029 [Verticillium dahliae]RXG47629.1 hypothetical protein VDGE_30007 [Verticillium dahliae]